MSFSLLKLRFGACLHHRPSVSPFGLEAAPLRMTAKMIFSCYDTAVTPRARVPHLFVRVGMVEVYVPSKIAFVGEFLPTILLITSQLLCAMLRSHMTPEILRIGVGDGWAVGAWQILLPARDWSSVSTQSAGRSLRNSGLRHDDEARLIGKEIEADRRVTVVSSVSRTCPAQGSVVSLLVYC